MNKNELLTDLFFILLDGEKIRVLFLSSSPFVRFIWLKHRCLPCNCWHGWYVVFLRECLLFGRLLLLLFLEHGLIPDGLSGKAFELSWLKTACQVPTYDSGTLQGLILNLNVHILCL